MSKSYRRLVSAAVVFGVLSILPTGGACVAYPGNPMDPITPPGGWFNICSRSIKVDGVWYTLYGECLWFMSCELTYNSQTNTFALICA